MKILHCKSLKIYVKFSIIYSSGVFSVDFVIFVSTKKVAERSFALNLLQTVSFQIGTSHLIHSAN